MKSVVLLTIFLLGFSCQKKPQAPNEKVSSTSIMVPETPSNEEAMDDPHHDGQSLKQKIEQSEKECTKGFKDKNDLSSLIVEAIKERNTILLSSTLSCGHRFGECYSEYDFVTDENMAELIIRNITNDITTKKMKNGDFLIKSGMAHPWEPDRVPNPSYKLHFMQNSYGWIWESTIVCNAEEWIKK